MVDTNSYKQKSNNSENSLKQSNNAKKTLFNGMEQHKKSKEDIISKFKSFKAPKEEKKK